MKMIGLAALSLSSWMIAAADVRTNAPSVPVRPAQDPVNEAQRTKMRETNEKFRAEQTVLYEKLRKNRKEMEQAAQADPIDETTIRARATVIGQIEGELALVRAKHYKELRTVLPHDQAARQSGLSTGTNQYQQRLQGMVRTNSVGATRDAATQSPSPKQEK